MKIATPFSFLAMATLSTVLPLVVALDAINVTEKIVNNAAADKIDLSVLDILDVALTEITAVYEQAPDSDVAEELLQRRRSDRFLIRGSGDDDDGSSSYRLPLADFLAGGSRIDVHSHVTPSWYRSLVPISGGNPTPEWDLNSHIAFMSAQSVDKAIIAFSTPGANVYQGNRLATVALARLINEQSAAYCAAHPSKFKFYAVVPLPHVQEAITEARYALNTLGAAGIILASNYEGIYLGGLRFKPFFQAVDNLSGKKIFFIHPGTPYIKYNNRLIEANPTRYPTDNIEFYFETARTLMDLSLTQTIHNFTSINYLFPHAGGAFPAALDRILKSVPTIYDSSFEIYRTRFWWDSAGPTYYHQVAGLLGYGIPTSQLVFGTDFPYAPSFTQTGSLGAILSSPLLTVAERVALFSTNARDLFSGSRKWLRNNGVPIHAARVLY